MRNIWKALRLWSLALVLLSGFFYTTPAAAATFLFVPIDDRPGLFAIHGGDIAGGRS